MNKMEIKTVYMNTEDYIKQYRDIPKFLEFCKACPRYEKCWACPEHGFDVENFLAPYPHVYLIGAKIIIDDEQRNSVKGKDAVGAMAEEITKDARAKLDPIVLSLEKTMGENEALCCYGGTCYLCLTCAKIMGQPCVHPGERRASLESLGFDVAGTTLDLLGYELLWSEDSLPEYLTVVSALFSKKLLPKRG
ncbi:MAG: DUF2284 domain-containing protein [Clostridiales bacterium]